ncbi:MAG: thioredoxin domain-containing protein [Armatimonadota bacterium]
MTKQQRTILTIVVSLIVVAAAVAGGILAIQGSKTGEKAHMAKTPSCPSTAPAQVPPTKPAQPGAGPVQQSVPAAETTTQPGAQSTTAKPETPPAPTVKFMELGAQWCGPCQSMKPIIKALEKEYKDKVEFVAIDVDQNKDIAQKYNVSSIPVQLIFQNDKQVFRHVGTISKEDIVAQFKKLGVTPTSK